MRLTNEKEEQQWQELKNHLEWAERFNLIILFVSDESLVDVFRTRLYHQQKGRVSTLKILKPKKAASLTKDFFSALESQIIPEVNVPLWLELYQHSDEWDAARNDFFSRLNEYRDQLRYKFPYPVIILVPLDYKRHLRDIAPDLWSIRSFTDELLSTVNISSLAHETTPQHSYHFEKSSNDSTEIAEWRRIQSQETSDYDQQQVGWRAFDAAFKLGNRKLAEQIINTCLTITRKQINSTPDSTDSLRYLTVFLNKKGNLENALGRREAAYELYLESLKISRRLLETLGETPESLRDLSVSLNNVGNIENALEFRDEAKEHFKECLLLLKRLKSAMPDIKEYDEIIEEIKEKLGSL